MAVLAEEQAAEAAPLKAADIKVNAVAAKTSKPAAAAAAGEYCLQARAPYEHLPLLPFDLTPPKELTRLFIRQWPPPLRQCQRHMDPAPLLPLSLPPTPLPLLKACTCLPSQARAAAPTSWHWACSRSPAQRPSPSQTAPPPRPSPPNRLRPLRQHHPPPRREACLPFKREAGIRLAGLAASV